LKALAVLLALVLPLTLGCGGDGGEGPSTTATSTATTPSGGSPAGTTTTAPSVPPIEEPSESETNSKKGGASPSRTATTPESRRVERYLRDNFGGAGAEPKSDWYDHLVEVSVSGTTTTVRTDLPDSDSGTRQARRICLDVRGSLPGITDSVRVTGLAANSELAKCVP
jgi:hypothetical protein